MPWYIGDFLRDTMHLDAEQDGAYRRLIDACWLRNGLLPDNDAQFSAITKLSLRRWLAVKPVVAAFFQVDVSGWRHKRVDFELRRAEKITEGKRKGGLSRNGASRSDDGTFINDQSSIAGSQLDGELDTKLGVSIQDPSIPSPSPTPSKKDSEAYASASETAVVDPVKAMWDRGLRVLIAGGVVEKQSRGLLGKWRRDFGDAALLVAIAACEDDHATEPIAFISGCLARSKRMNGHAKTAATERFDRGTEILLDAVVARETARFTGH
jgi:uncharacterized protein YdaU (DUF1376 family)